MSWRSPGANKIFKKDDFGCEPCPLPVANEQKTEDDNFAFLPNKCLLHDSWKFPEINKVKVKIYTKEKYVCIFLAFC